MTTQHARRTVVVGVDGSAEALRAVRWAAPEARRRQAVLRLVTGFAWTEYGMPGLPGLGSAYAVDRLRTAADTALAAAAAAATEAEPGVTVEQDVVLGFASGVLVGESQLSELVVVGDRGRGRISSVFAGSVAVAAAANAACPVVVVRGEERDAALPVVVGIDGTPVSEAAIAFAFDAASSRRAPLLAVHTWVAALGDPSLAPLIDWEVLAAEEEEVLAERLAGWGEKYPDVAVQRMVAKGGAAHALLDLTERAQLVVVGSRGHGELAGFVLGSVSNALVHAATCPVAVVRPAGE